VHDEKQIRVALEHDALAQARERPHFPSAQRVERGSTVRSTNGLCSRTSQSTRPARRALSASR
jgi:hypothetical protein